MLARGEGAALRGAKEDDVLVLRAENQRLWDRNQELERQVAAGFQAANRDLEALWASVSHDLRAPLRHIDGFSAALEEDFGPRLGELAQDHIRCIRTAVRQMGNLIDDLVKLSRVALADMMTEDVDLTSLCQDIAAALGRLAPNRRVAWTVAARLSVRGDRALLSAALDALLDNAWKFTARRTDAAIEVGLEPGQAGSGPCLFVRDNGVGFDMRYVDKLFRPFQRLHRENEFAGSGMGLATVQRVLARHGGRVWAEGEVGRGATIRAALPGLRID